jgi:predicted transcriptional regulator
VTEALFSGNPTVIVFAAPSFCTSPTCGPQVDTIVELKDAYLGEASFIHVEIYDNPDEIQGDLSRGVLSPFVNDWGLDSVPHYRNESWVFVLGRDGRITHRFEGYATFEELEVALLQVLER